MQLFGVSAAFVSIVVLSVKKAPLWKVMCAATVIISVTSGPFDQSIGIILASLKDITTIDLTLSVLSIGVFSTIMNEIGYLDKMVNGLLGFLGNLKAAIMTVPALIGSMPVLGGAAVSAPLVDRIGSGLSLSPEKKATINLVFRHGMFFVFPFSPSMILASNLLDVPVTTLVARLWPYGLMFWITGYLFLLAKDTEAPISAESTVFGSESAATEPALSHPKDSRLTYLSGFLKYGSPLLLALALSLLFSLPLWTSLSAGILLALLMAHHETLPLPSLAAISKGANMSQVMAMLLIMVFKGLVSASPVFPEMVSKATQKGISPALLAVALPFLLGYATASQTTTIGVLLPILVPTGISHTATMHFMAVIYGSSFISYFASPLHLCQILTCEYYDTDLTKVYRLYWPVLVFVAAIVAFYAVAAARVV